jgi:paraquat-inducible protein B
MGKIHRLPLDEIATNLNSTLSGASSFANSPELQDTLLKINRAATSLDAILESVDEEAAPTMQSIRRAAVQAERTLAEAREALTILDEGSPVRADLARTLEEAAGAARSIRLLADYLERKPDALLYGKGGARR